VWGDDVKARSVAVAALALVVAMPIATVIGTLASARQMTPTCDGKVATKVGTRDDDVLRGTRRRDVIVGLGGDDVIEGRGNRDTICGNRGADHLFGGKGLDNVIGGLGRDRLEEKYVGGGNSLDGSAGRDMLSYLRAGPVVVLLGPGEAAAGCPRGEYCLAHWDPDFMRDIEIVVGSPYDDSLVGDGRRNLLRGKPGRDHLRGKGGGDRLFGGIGRDSLNGNDGTDELFGGEGRDRCRSAKRHRCER
jgi:Ca2+-binding RTX toxin-like protein